MENPGLPPDLWKVLDGRLWHATSIDGLAGIVADGAIRVTDERYRNAFSKMMSAVSLFDFGPSARDDWDQFSNWSGWFGSQQDCRVAVWLQIDREATASSVFDAAETHRQWSDHRGKQVIPGVEALHVGPIPAEAVVSMLLVDSHDRSRFGHFSDPPLSQNDVQAFLATLPPEPPEPTLAKLLRAARERYASNT